MSYISGFYPETYRAKATIAHANSMMALTIGTWASLHRSPVQQSIPHFVIFTEGKMSALQSDEVIHSLTKTSTAAAELSALKSALAQRSSLLM